MSSAGPIFARPRATTRMLDDGTIEIVSLLEPSEPPPTTLHWLAAAAARTPEAPLMTWMADGGDRQVLTYGEAWTEVQTLASGLRARGYRRGGHVAVLARNGPRHFIIGHAAMLAGLVWAPIAPQYAAPGANPARLEHVLDLLDPVGVYLDSRADSPGAPRGLTVLEGDGGIEMLRDAATDDVANLAEIDPQSISKILLTSGSTGTPKAVLHSHRMVTANVQATLDVWPFFAQETPVLVDWLPWNHAFGGNSNLNMVLSRGGVLHVDEAMGVPGSLPTTIANIIRFRPTYYAAVPAVFSDMVPYLESHPEFRAALFHRVQALFSAGAALSGDTFERLRAASLSVRDEPVPVLSGWGSTELGPGATMVHDHDSQPGWIGEPLPGVVVRMAPVGEKYELRVKSPSMTSGYWREPERTRDVLDEDGFYRSGDAGVLVDPSHPEHGLRFDGRIAEDFKLSNGSWVNTQRLRGELLDEAGGAARDVVVAGPDRPYLIALVWPADGAVLDLQAWVERHNSGRSGRTNLVCCAIRIDSPEPVELSPKSQLRPNVVLARRAALIEEVYAHAEERVP